MYFFNDSKEKIEVYEKTGYEDRLAPGAEVGVITSATFLTGDIRKLHVISAQIATVPTGGTPTQWDTLECRDGKAYPQVALREGRTYNDLILLLVNNSNEIADVYYRVLIAKEP